ncbi:MAG: hypothetical protein AAF572_08400 [Cyanobacteria bacterium P01_B01_bin.77]
MSVELQTFLLITLLYSLQVLIPGFIASIQGVSLGSTIFDVPTLFEEAIEYSITYLLSYIFVFLFLAKLVNLKRWYVDTSYIHEKSKILSTFPTANKFKFLRFGWLSLFFGLVLSIYFTDYYQVFFEASGRHFSEEPVIQNLIQLLYLVGLIFGLLSRSRKLSRHLLVVISAISYLLYPIAISSRAVAIPCVVIFLYYFSVEKKIIQSVITAYATVVTFVTSLIARSQLGFYNFIQIFLDVIFNPSYIIYEKLLFVTPGIGTTSLALEMFEDRASYGLMSFLRYVSPLPSFILAPLGSNSSIELGFTNYLNATNIGLNTDIFSEWIFWFGSWGGVCGGAFLAILTVIPILLRKKYIDSYLVRILFQISTLFYFLAGASMSVRAASRLYIYILIIVAYACFRREKKSRFRLNHGH